MLSALELAIRIDTGTLTPRDVVEMCAAAIAEREAVIGAFVTFDVDAARRMAVDAAQRLAAAPLRGLPVGVKDVFDTFDFPTEYGSPIYAGNRPRADAALVALTRRAGGIVLGKTVTAELAYVHPGKTRNPHDPDHTPGVSSSGSAAAVAAGMVPLAIGTQTGGSVIRPAAYCGVAGFKPSHKLMPLGGAKCFSSHLDTAGLFAATIADVAFAAAAITGRDLWVDHRDAGPPRLALVRTPAWEDASADMRGAVEGTARRAEKAGAAVRDLDLPPIFADALQAFSTIQGFEGFHSLAFEYDRHREALSPVLRKLLDAAAGISVDAYDEARRVSRRVRQTFADLAGDFDAILTPSAPGAAPDGDAVGSAAFNRLWTLIGSPCVNVPGMADAAGLPLGLQVVGRFGRDRTALAAARFVELALAGS
jgi:Asp-tRNA(Asn)/Glu-tRNA(Gln) amidotransferase A subunit family amidase